MRLRLLAFATFLVWRLRIGACGVGACGFWRLWQLPENATVEIHSNEIGVVLFERISNARLIRCWMSSSRSFIIMQDKFKKAGTVLLLSPFTPPGNINMSFCMRPCRINRENSFILSPWSVYLWGGDRQTWTSLPSLKPLPFNIPSLSVVLWRLDFVSVWSIRVQLFVTFWQLTRSCSVRLTLVTLTLLSIDAVRNHKNLF